MPFINKWIRLTISVLLGCFYFASLATAATPAVYTWGSYDPNGQNLGFVDDNGDPLADGSAIQLIWSGPNGRVDPPQAATGAVTGDDQIIASRTLPASDTYPPPLRDKGYLLAQLNYDTDQPYNNGYVYMRAWNAPTVGRNGGATAYGDSQLLLLTSSGTGIQLGVTTNRSTATAITLADVHGGNVEGSRPWLFFIAAVLGVLTGGVVWQERRVLGNL